MRTRILVTVLATSWGVAASAHAGLINGGFETGDLAGWTVFTTANGTIGGLGDIVMFDVDGDGSASASVRFRTATAVYSGVPEGGGVFQQLALGAGRDPPSPNPRRLILALARGILLVLR